MKRILPCLAFVAALAPGAVSAEQIYTNNMSDTAVLMTAYDASSPAKVVGEWCVETGSFEKHDLKLSPAQVQAKVMHEGCKEPIVLNRTLPLSHGGARAATLYRLTGNKGKYSLSGPFTPDVMK